MHLKSVELSNFRSFAADHFEFCPGLNIVLGPNASGKTNLLEAIYMLSNLRSFRTHSFRELITWRETEAYVRGIVQSGTGDLQTAFHTSLSVGIKTNARTPLINSKRCKSSKDYLRLLPSTAFVPDDLSLVKGSPVSRRYFLDRGTFHLYPSYWALLSDYNRILRQKNTLLRDFHRKERHGDALSSGKLSGSDSWDIWNTQLQTVGSHVILHRLAFIRQLQVFLKKVYTTWLGSEETIDIHYKSSIGPLPEDQRDPSDPIDMKDIQLYQRIQEAYGQAIQRNSTRERRLGTTLIGPHRDDLHVELAERSIRSYGSQGQQRTAVLALKLAEVSLYFEQYAEYPILLLDDVTSELDIRRNTRLLERLLQGMQVFMSTTDRSAFSALQALPCTYFDLS